MRTRWLMLTGMVLLAVGAAAQSYPPPYPRKNATKVLETGQFIVWQMVWPKGEPTPMHRHVHDQVGTYYATGGRRITPIEGEPREASTPVGNLSTTKAGTTHIEEGTTDPPLRAIFMELLHDRPSGPAPTASATPAVFPREDAKQTLDDERVTVWDYTWKNGTAQRMVRYPRNTITVWLSDGKLKATSSTGKETTLSVKPGDTRYTEADTIERLDVVAGTPHAMVFEFK